MLDRLLTVGKNNVLTERLTNFEKESSNSLVNPILYSRNNVHDNISADCWITVSTACDTLDTASAAASDLDEKNGRLMWRLCHSPEANFGSMISFFMYPKDSPPMSHAAYRAAYKEMMCQALVRKQAVISRVPTQKNLTVLGFDKESSASKASLAYFSGLFFLSFKYLMYMLTLSESIMNRSTSSFTRSGLKCLLSAWNFCINCSFLYR